MVLFEDTKLDGKKYDDLQTSKNFDTRSRYNQTFRNAPDKFLIHVRCSTSWICVVVRAATTCCTAFSTIM